MLGETWLCVGTSGRQNGFVPSHGLQPLRSGVEKYDSLASTRPFLALETQQDKWKIEEGQK